LLTFRHETPADREAVTRVVRDAFGGDDEVRLVDSLREAGHILLSVVAEEDGEVIGHIAFSPMTIDSETDTYAAICLAPLAVVSSRQKQGVGGALMSAALDELRATVDSAVFLLGHPRGTRATTRASDSGQRVSSTYTTWTTATPSWPWSSVPALWRAFPARLISPRNSRLSSEAHRHDTGVPVDFCPPIF
jgi:putative acetyltransferase